MQIFFAIIDIDFILTYYELWCYSRFHVGSSLIHSLLYIGLTEDVKYSSTFIYTIPKSQIFSSQHFLFIILIH